MLSDRGSTLRAPRLRQPGQIVTTPDAQSAFATTVTTQRASSESGNWVGAEQNEHQQRRPERKIHSVTRPRDPCPLPGCGSQQIAEEVRLSGPGCGCRFSRDDYATSLNTHVNPLVQDRRNSPLTRPYRVYRAGCQHDAPSRSRKRQHNVKGRSDQIGSLHSGHLGSGSPVRSYPHLTHRPRFRRR